MQQGQQADDSYYFKKCLFVFMCGHLMEQVKLIQRSFQNVRDHARKRELEEGNGDKSGGPLREGKVTT